MASKSAGILSPTAEPAPKLTGQPAQNDDSNKMTAASASTMSHDRAATAPPQDQHSTKEHENEIRAQSLEYKTHLEQAKDTSQLPSNNKVSSTSVNPDTVPIDPREAAATIAALRQNLYIAEQHILHFRNEASSHIFQLETLVRSSWTAAMASKAPSTTSSASSTRPTTTTGTSTSTSSSFAKKPRPGRRNTKLLCKPPMREPGLHPVALLRLCRRRQRCHCLQ